MAWHIPLALGGPVLHWELVRGSRQSWQRFLWYGYGVFLIVQVISVYASYRSSTAVLMSEEQRARILDCHFLLQQAELERLLSPEERIRFREMDQMSGTELERARYEARAAFCQSHLLLLMQQQLLLLLLLAPLLTAGALGHEKERGTLAALFATEMTAWQIVVGKLLGRLVRLLPAMISLPVLLMLSIIGDIEPSAMLLGCVQAAMLTFAVASICLLGAVWTRRTSDAILGCYTVIALIILASLSVLADTPLPGWLDPIAILSKLRRGVAPPDFLPHLAAWGVVGLGCLVLAAMGLRQVCLGQLEKRPARWLWAFRPRVGNDPIRWRERYVIGLAPLPWLRGVPTWMALLGVLSFSAILAASAIDAMARGMFPALRAFDFERAWKCFVNPSGPDTVLAEVSVMGGVLLLLSGLVVGVRCGTSIAEEKRRGTWDDLLLTGMSIPSIIRSKQWGVLQATLPYIVAYIVPMFVLASMGGFAGCLIAATWLTAAVSVMLIVSNMASNIPDEAEGPVRRKARGYRRPPAREAPEEFNNLAPVEGAVLLEDITVFTEEEIADFLIKEYGSDQ
jgi:hypothetical protein